MTAKMEKTGVSLLLLLLLLLLSLPNLIGHVQKWGVGVKRVSHLTYGAL